MPTDRSAPSFELEDARATSQRLQRGAGSSASGPGPSADAGPAYTRFDASRLVTERPAPASVAIAAAEAPPASDESVALHAAGSWEDMLDWFLELSRGHTCFVMDPHGLSAAARGRVPEQGDAVGPRLMIALDQAALMQPDGRSAASVLFECGDGWISGVSGETAGDARLTVGIMSDVPVTRSVRDTLARTIRAKLDAR